MALALPAAAAERLAAWGRGVVRGLPGRARALPADTLHMTLVFIGERPAREVDTIAAACSIASAWPRISLSPGEPVWLPPRRPRVLAIELSDPAGALCALQAALAARLAAAGVISDAGRPFRPHVSVARTRGTAPRRPARRPPADAASESRAATVPAPALEPFEADAVALLRSLPGAGGPRYLPLATFALTGP
ncbi:MAG TPA: RNA 2',3'-cyclic phosphodiesterase [Solirubrobacteraceae bacterium]|nr:RNA 2',3'-cyclic phosphodiesterase [Solirubrobacteraceae bacterium]